jgi:phytol kinase
VGAWIALIGLLAEGLHRYAQFGSETTRKVVHIGVGNVILFAWWLNIPAWIGITASIVFGAISVLSYRFPILPSINSVGRKSLGTFFYAISIGILIAAFWISKPYYAVLGILVMTWGDGLAALIGQRLGQRPYKVWGMEKSWEGSLTMAIVSYAVSSLILLSMFGNVWQTWAFPIVIALVATVLESFSKFGIDNLTVPLGSATIAFVLEKVFPLS